MKVTRVVRSDEQPPVDCSSCAARNPVAAEVELSEGAALVDISERRKTQFISTAKIHTGGHPYPTSGTAH